jgi:hypothetical protein
MLQIYPTLILFGKDSTHVCCSHGRREERASQRDRDRIGNGKAETENGVVCVPFHSCAGALTQERYSVSYDKMKRKKTSRYVEVLVNTRVAS